MENSRGSSRRSAPGGRFSLDKPMHTSHIRTMKWNGDQTAREALLTREWLVTNGLGGYASGTVSGAITRRYHGMLVAALPAPLGRMVVFSHLCEHLRFSTDDIVSLGGEERAGGQLHLHGADYLREFRLEWGLPVWIYKVRDLLLEKRILLPHQQNTVHLSYRLLEGGETIPELELRPSFHFRHHESPVSEGLEAPYKVAEIEQRYEISATHAPLPPVRMRVYDTDSHFTINATRIHEVVYRLEEERGYEFVGDLWSPGSFHVQMHVDRNVTLVASTESWETIDSVPPETAEFAERERRKRLLDAAAPEGCDGIASELVFAADQFIITPAGRAEEAARAHASGDEVRTVVAGYHWFTDWGRDTMISLEGLTLTTGRHLEAGYILRTFAHYVHEGLIPNMFPDGEKEGLYHTADATLWFFHALRRYLNVTRDQITLKVLLPVLCKIADAHLAGTLFNIHVDPADGLLSQGAEGYQLTWMDAKMGDWVVTPRRGKAVEINALWFNAISQLAEWLTEENDSRAKHYASAAAKCRQSFNERFWFAEGGYLFDVIDGPDGKNDPACRPNQVFAISLDHPVLEPKHWRSVMDVVEEKLLTPVGLRSLSPDHPDYQRNYHGDLRTRDAAYHQGTVWAWLIGPFIDGWKKVHPERANEAHQFLRGFEAHLGEAGIGTISEVFDAEKPHTPRGCIAQAWSIAEVLRCWVQ